MIDTIKNKLQTTYPEAHIVLHSSDEVHFDLTILDDAFNGAPLLNRHRAVYAALGDSLMQRIHALSIKAQTHSEAKQAEN